MKGIALTFLAVISFVLFAIGTGFILSSVATPTLLKAGMGLLAIFVSAVGFPMLMEKMEEDFLK